MPGLSPQNFSQDWANLSSASGQKSSHMREKTAVTSALRHAAVSREGVVEAEAERAEHLMATTRPR